MGAARIAETPSLHGVRRAPSIGVQKNWRDVAAEAKEQGYVAVTVHGDVDAVAVSLREIERKDREISELREKVGQLMGAQSPVDALRERFLERLRSRDPETLNAATDAASATPVRLGGRLKVGD